MHQHKCANKRQFSTDGIDKRNTCGNTFENYNLERVKSETWSVPAILFRHKLIFQVQNESTAKSRIVHLH